MDSTLLNIVIDGLEHCIKEKCDGCPYRINGDDDFYDVRCINNLMKDSFYLHTGRAQGAGHLVD